MKSKWSAPSSSLLIGLGLILVLAKLWLTRAQPQFVIGGAGHDDLLFINMADHIIHGRWLGPYNEMTLAKGPFYPLWIAAMHALGIPLRMGTELAYAGACGLTVLALRPIVRNGWLALAIFGFLLANPMTYEMHPMGRVIRQAIWVPLTLGVVACFLGLALRPALTAWRRLPWALTAGLLFGCYWLTREEGVWLVPGLAMLAAAVLLRSWLAARWRGLGGATGALLAFAIAGSTPILTVSALNKAYYDWFGTVEFREEGFKDAYGALMRIKVPNEIPMVYISREARELAYPHSPTLALLRDRIEGRLGRDWSRASASVTHLPEESLEIGGGWFMWMMRQGVAELGYYKDARQSAAFYRAIADEVNAACDAGLIPAGPRRSGFFPPWQKHYTPALLKSLKDFGIFFLSFDGFSAQTAPSVGDPNQLALFHRVTGEVESPLWGVPFSETWTIATATRDTRIDWLNWLGSKLCSVILFLNVSALVLYALRTMAGLFRRDLGFPFIASTALMGSCFASILLNCLVNVTSFDTLSTAAFAQIYPLVLLFDIIVLLDCATWVSRWWLGRGKSAASTPLHGTTTSPVAPVAAGRLMLAGAVLVVLASAASLLHHHGSELPFMDQWDSEGVDLLLPKAQGTLTAAQLIAPHTEDRPVLGRLLSLAGTSMNGQWDPRFLGLANVLLLAGFVGIILAWCRRQMTPLAFALCAIVTAVLFALPLGWETTLLSFLAGWRLCILLSIAALLVLLPAPPLSARWFTGLLLGLAASASAAPGFLVPASACLCLVTGALATRTWSQRHLAALALLLVSAAATLWWVNTVPAHVALGARGAVQLALSTASCLSWPLHESSSAFALLVGMPWLATISILLIQALRRTPMEPRRDAALSVVAGLGVWSLLLAGWVAWSRGANGCPPSSRHAELLACWVVINLLALCLLAPRLPRPAFMAACLVWLCPIGVGLTALTQKRSAEVRDFSIHQFSGLNHLRHFAATGDRGILALAPLEEVPHPSKEHLAGLCTNPGLIPVLPAPLRHPTPLQLAPSSTGFTPAPLPALPTSPGFAHQLTTAGGPAYLRTEPIAVAHNQVLRLPVRHAAELPSGALRLRLPDGSLLPSDTPTEMLAQGWRIHEFALPETCTAASIELELPPSLGPVSIAAPEFTGHLASRTRRIVATCAHFLLPGLFLFGFGLLLAIPLPSWLQHPRKQSASDVTQ